MVIFPELFNGPETTVLTEGPQIEARDDERLGNANTPTADGLATLPRGYTGLARKVPVLGPPLPGDLGVASSCLNS